MKIENMDRAINAKRELDNLNNAISVIQNRERSAVMFNAHIDGSGFSVGLQYKNGDYHPMYDDIMSYVEVKFKEARDELIAEIESL